VSNTPSCRPLWARFAAWLGFLAVFSALLAPVSMLAEDMRTGKLGGLCAVASGASSTAAGDLSGGDESSPAAAHCDFCGSTGPALPPPYRAGVFPAPIPAMVAVFDDAVHSASSPGLPFSRGPPAV
jgi:hypothetical protein